MWSVFMNGVDVAVLLVKFMRIMNVVSESIVCFALFSSNSISEGLFIYLFFNDIF